MFEILVTIDGTDERQCNPAVNEKKGITVAITRMAFTNYVKREVAGGRAAATLLTSHGKPA